MDADLQTLRRRAASTGAPDDRAALLRARVRAGELALERVELAGHLGDEAAARVAGLFCACGHLWASHDDGATTARGPRQPLGCLFGWGGEGSPVGCSCAAATPPGVAFVGDPPDPMAAAALSRCPEARVRAAIAAGRAAWPLWLVCRQRSEAEAGSVAIALAAAETWAVCPCDRHGDEWAAAWAGAWGPSWGEAHQAPWLPVRPLARGGHDNEAAIRSAALLAGTLAREAIARELIPWALGERDPVAERVAARG